MGNTIINESCLTGLSKLPEKSVQCCVTSPPYYGLRDYGHADQLGLEETPEQYVQNMVQVFREVRRVLADDGTLWLNLGDSYNAYKANTGDSKYAGFSGRPEHKKGLTVQGLKNKDLIGIPWRVAFALQADGWYLRQDIIWHKPNPMPESVTDRCTKAHEYIFLLSKSPRYYYDAEAVAEEAESLEHKLKSYHNPDSDKYNAIPDERWKDQFNGRQWGKVGTRNRRSVWTVPTKPYTGAHFAVFPDSLITPCVQAGTKPGDIVLDPFFGSGTTGEVALRLGRQFIGFEINPEYIKLAEKRLQPHLHNLFSHGYRTI